MKAAYWLAGALALGQTACGEARSSKTDAAAVPAYVPSEACPLKTRVAWQGFLESAADDAAWVKTCSDRDDCEASVGDFARHVRADLLDVFSLCASDLRDDPALAACTANLRRFAAAWLRQHASDAYGFEQGNADYFAAQVAEDSPGGMMNPPQALLDALPARASVEAAAKANGWPYLTHDSCLGGLRTFINIVDADDRFEQWLLFGFGPQQPELSENQLISFIAIQKQTADGARLAAARMHFRDYALARDGAGFQLDLPVEGGGKCYACHTSGVRQLIAFPSSATASAPVRGEADYKGLAVPTDFGERRLNALNEHLASYGLPSWNGSIEPDDYGPALGAELGCTHCHNGTIRGPLTVFTSEGMLYQKVVDQLSMRSFDGSAVVPDLPAMALLQRERADASALSAGEQRELEAARTKHELDFSALVASRLPAWKAWVLRTACE
jgi:hypothetical protein